MENRSVSRPRSRARRVGRVVAIGIVVAGGGCLATRPAWAQRAGSPPAAEKASDEACHALREEIHRAWVAGAYRSMENPDPAALRWFEGSQPDPEKAASFPALWEDYVRRCPCEMLDRERYGYGSELVALINYIPAPLKALYEDALDRCGGPWWSHPVPIATAGVLAAGGTVLALSGKGETSPTSNPGSPGAGNVASPSPPPVFNPDGTYSCTTEVTGGDRRHPPFIGLAPVLQLFFRSQGATLTVTGQPGDNFVPVTGPFDAGSRTANLNGSGTVAGRAGVGVRLELVFTADNAATGTYTVGIGGGLPDGTTTQYGFQCRR